MVFSSILFLLYFLPVFLLIYSVVPQKARNGVALGASILFYAWGAPVFIGVLIASSFIDHQLGLRMERSNRERTRRQLLALGVVLNVGLLAYFKYANFYFENVSALLTELGIGRLRWVEVALPIGISFFTFQKLSFLVDTYRREAVPFSQFHRYLLFVILFPQLIAGPIVRFREIADQIRDRSESEVASMRFTGLYRFIIGLAKKVLIANTLGAIADPIFDANPAELTSAQAWVGMLAYTFQIYYDFAGYSDMAIGLGQMMGFRFPENFNFPYVSRSITEFWRRWHITLSQWMRDYLYIPLGGNRKSIRRTYMNLWLVFLISGLWHGASWNFVIWGAYHGLFLVLERAFWGRSMERWPRLLSIPLTFLIASLGWVFFRTADFHHAQLYFGQLFASVPHFASVDISAKVVTAGIIAAVFAFIGHTKMATRLVHFYSIPTARNSVVVAQFLSGFLLLVWSIGEIAAGGFNPFIYFRF